MNCQLDNSPLMISDRVAHPIAQSGIPEKAYRTPSQLFQLSDRNSNR
ncbi:hypothetical protein ACE1CI_10870 [Aerosakkonemataceae cyanobacterium BLCC-F50]|uniref:Uncharacterized protein n=1 Tax=Floridaenema flaviceps BLCC-F50 TaxID=3153642 RepID=A0ABV4XPE6_9CYAN